MNEYLNSKQKNYISTLNFFFFLHRVNYLEIYNEKVYNLLNDRKEFKLNELPNGELNIEDGQLVSDKEGIIKIIEDGNAQRKVAETKMNVQSSRSHAVLQIVSVKHFNVKLHSINSHI